MNKIVSRLVTAGALAVTAYAAVGSASQSVCPLNTITVPTPLAGKACPVNGFNSTSIVRNSAGAPNTWDYRIRLDVVKAGTTSQLVAGDLINSAGNFIRDVNNSQCCEAVDIAPVNGNFGGACNCATSGVSPNIANRFRVFYNFSP
jgi:hypothetical protein